ncbi:TadE family protein [Vibrio europaeus]|uniref:TadE family protein n=1 Tax=Vibrio europaeus TaxID=300876 RepID=UPI0026491B70|nr:TadE family protein [Vibrio europaeus]
MTIIEFTLVSVLFMFMICSIIEGARYVYSNGLAREGARYAAVRGSQAVKDPLRSSDAPATESTISAFVQSRSPINNVTTSVVWSPDNSPGSEVDVTVSHDFSSFITLFNDVTISSTASSTIYF